MSPSSFKPTAPQDLQHLRETVNVHLSRGIIIGADPHVKPFLPVGNHVWVIVGEHDVASVETPWHIEEILQTIPVHLPQL